MEQFYGVFRAYNIAVWPAQWFLIALGTAAVALVLAPRRWSGVAVSAILGVLWAWIAVAYHLEGLATLDQIRRLLEIAVADTLGLENSIARSRVLAYLAQVALRVVEAADLQERVIALETAVGPRLAAGRRR